MPQLRDFAESKRDYFTIDPRKLKVDPSYNVRDLNTPNALAKLDELKASIIENGVRVPLEVRLQGEEIYVVAGHRRLAATLAAIAEGAEIKSIPCVPEPKHISDADRCLGLVVSNDGEPLKPLELAEVCRRLVAYGWDHQQIARRCGRKSSQWVKDHLDLLALPGEAKEMVKRAEVSATEARKVHREAKKDGAETVATLKAAKEEAKARGKTKATRKVVESVSKPKASPAARGKEDALLDFASLADKAQSYAQIDGGTPSPEHAQEIMTALGAALEKAKGRGVKAPPPAPVPVPGGMNGHAVGIASLIAALAPFDEIDRMYQDSDLSERISVSAEVVHKAAEAWRAATGGENAAA